MSVWVVCFVYIRFDLDIGPKAEYVTPHDALTESGKNEVIKSAFPDCNPDCQHNFIFTFTLKDYTHAAEQVTPEASVSNPKKGVIISKLYGAAYYRQKYDKRVQRSYVQQAIVLLSRLPYIGVHELILRTVAPRFAQCCCLSPDNEITAVSSALSPFPSVYQHMDLSYNPDQYTQEQVLDEAIKEIAEWPSPHPHVRYEVLLLRQVLVFVTVSRFSVPTNARQWQQHAVKRPSMCLDHRTLLLKPRTSTMDYDTISQIFSSQNLFPVYKLLRDHITHLTYLWELVISHQPLLILSNIPSTASAVALAVASLVSPLPYTGIMSSYFTMQSNEFSRFTRMGKALRFPSTEGIIVAGTNPLLIRSFDVWPSLLVVIDRFVKSRGGEQLIPTPNLQGKSNMCQSVFTSDALVAHKLISPTRCQFPTQSPRSGGSSFPFKTRPTLSSECHVMQSLDSCTPAAENSEVYERPAMQILLHDTSTTTEKEKATTLPNDNLPIENTGDRTARLFSSTLVPSCKVQAPKVSTTFHTFKEGICTGMESKILDFYDDTKSSLILPRSSECVSRSSQHFTSCGSSPMNDRGCEAANLNTQEALIVFSSRRSHHQLPFSSSSSSRGCTPSNRKAMGVGVDNCTRSTDAVQGTPRRQISLLSHLSSSPDRLPGPASAAVLSFHAMQHTQHELKRPLHTLPHSSFSRKAYDSKYIVNHKTNASPDYIATPSNNNPDVNGSKMFTPDCYKTLKEAANVSPKNISISMPKQKKARNQLQCRLVNYFDSTFHFLLNHKEQTSYLLESLQVTSRIQKEDMTDRFRFYDEQHPCELQSNRLGFSTASSGMADIVNSCSDPLFSQLSASDNVTRKFFVSLTHEFLSPITSWFMAVTHNISSFNLCDLTVVDSLLCASSFLIFFRENHKRITPGLWTRHYRYAKYKIIYERFARGSLFQAYIQQLLDQKLWKELDEFQLEEWVKNFPYETERIKMLTNLCNVAKREISCTLDPDVLFIRTVTSVAVKMCFSIGQPLQDQLLAKINDLKL